MHWDFFTASWIIKKCDFNVHIFVTFPNLLLISISLQSFQRTYFVYVLLNLLRPLLWPNITLAAAAAKSLLSCPTLCDPWTIVHQAPLSMESPDKNIGVDCYALLQGIFPTQRSNPCLYISCVGRWVLYH